MITCDFSIIPIGGNKIGCSEYVSAAVKSIEKSGLNYKLTGMGTQIEADNLEELFSTIIKAQNEVFETGIGRVYTVIKIDDRRDSKEHDLNEKVKAVENLKN